MSSFIVAQLLAGGLLVAFFTLRPLHGMRVASRWLASWSALYLAGLLIAGAGIHPVFLAAAIGVATLHAPLLYSGACMISGRSTPRWLIPAISMIAVARFALTLLGHLPAVLLSFIPVSLTLELASAWLMWRSSEEVTRHRRRLLAILFAVYAGGHTVWLVGTARESVPEDLLNALWIGAALFLILAQIGVLSHEQRSHQKSLLALNERLGRMLERSSDLVAWARIDGGLQYVNPALAAHAGLEEASPAGVPLFSLLSADARLRLETEAWPEALAGNTWRGELTLRRPDAEAVPVSAVIVPQHGASGEIEAIGCLMRDLTERARTEGELRRRVAFEHQVARISTELLLRDGREIDRTLDATLEVIGRFLAARQAWIFLLDAQAGCFTLHHSWQASGAGVQPGLLDGAACAQLPWLFEQLRDGRVVHLRSSDDLPAEAVLDRLLLDGSAARNLAFIPLRLGTDLLGTLALEQPDGRGVGEDEMAPVHLAADFVTNALGRHRAALLIQEREGELRQAQKMEAVGQLAGGVAHDFNNLLTVISGYAEVLQADAELSSRQRDEVEQILLAAQRATSLTSQLLAFSRRQILEPHPFDLNERLVSLMSMLRRTVGERIELTTSLAAKLPLVRADPSQIDQVVVNLVVNARDAIDGDGAIRLTTARVAGREGGGREPRSAAGWVCLSVTDDGCGMDAHTRSRVFEPFFTTKDPGAGTGLGLSTAYGILSQSGGAIEVSSDEGVGTSVRVYLPVAERAATPSPGPSRPLPSPDGRRSGTLLVVEDELKVRRLLQSILQEAGFDVLEARHGLDALEVAEAHGGTLDLVITDVVMPHLGGPELVAELRAQRETLPALFVSGYPNRYGGETSLPGLFLAKPFTRGELLEAVDSLLAAGRSGRRVS